MQINFHAMDLNKYRYIQTPIGFLIFEVIGHVYSVQCGVLQWVDQTYELMEHFNIGVNFFNVTP